jgi:hypothetical protein
MVDQSRSPFAASPDPFGYGLTLAEMEAGLLELRG